MPQQPPTTFRIEDLKARLKLEPKSRLFYPLAEEFRKLDRFEDAEKVLRDGLAVHPGYTSAWISLGRVLLEQQKQREAVEPLQKAFTLDPGNVVAARLMADAYLALGQKVEAIKKYKLVRALLPADEEIEATIEQLAREIGPAAAPVAAPTETRAEMPAPSPTASPQTAGLSERTTDTEPFLAAEPAVPLTPAFSSEGPVAAVDVDAAMSGASFTAAAEPFAEEIVPPRSEVVGAEEVAAEEQREFPLGKPEMVFPEAAAAASPSEEPFPAAHEAAPPSEATSVFDETMPLRTEKPPTDLPMESPFATATMADLYARQGHAESAREIYHKLLDKEPQNAAIREKLESLTVPSPLASEPESKKKVVNRLEGWLSKMGKK